MTPDIGLHNPLVIDVLARDPDGAIRLVMLEDRPWDGSDERLLELQNKVNAYLSYALDGQLEREHPGTGGSALVLELDCVEPPDAMVRGLLGPLRAALEPLRVRFEVKLRGIPGTWSDPDESGAA